MIIALTGKKGSGKTTVADILADEYGLEQYALAEPMKDFSSKVFGWDREYIEKHKEEIDEEWGIIPREFWQWIGTDAMQHSLCAAFPLFAATTGRMVWVRRFSRRIWHDGDWVISDVRFPHEVAGLMEIGTPVHVVRVERDHDDADPHASEQEMDSIKAEVIIRNIGSIEELYPQIDAMMQRFTDRGMAGVAR